jgi:hypothetical protein
MGGRKASGFRQPALLGPRPETGGFAQKPHHENTKERKHEKDIAATRQNTKKPGESALGAFLDFVFSFFRVFVMRFLCKA